MATSSNNPTSEIQLDPASNTEMSQNKDNLGPDEGSNKKGRGLLKVPSKSSLHKNESPTTTGLSGPTVSESRTSIDRRSQNSKGSFLGRQRNGSTSSKRTGGESNPTNTAGNTQPNSPVPKKKKNGGFLSFLGCCGVADSSNTGEGDNENAHKLDTLPKRPATAKSWTPQDAKERAANEKHAGAAPKKTEQGTTGNDDDRIAPVDGETAKATPPAVTVEPPKGGKDGGSAQAEQTARDDDVKMHDAAEEPVVAAPVEERKVAPPPPAAPTVPITFADAGPSEPIRLLPAIRPEHKGRKCLVLDLDETLVHSSFKILHQADFTIPVEIEGNYHNVYVIKRPGVDEFMKRVGELYEVVVFTASVSKYGDPLLDQLDIHKVVHHRLFRESCYNHQGNYVKDLSQVGRDLKDTIIIDNSPTSYIFHPQHAVPISSWFSDAHDNELLDLIPVLEDLAGPTVADVSLVLDVTL